MGLGRILSVPLRAAQRMAGSMASSIDGTSRRRAPRRAARSGAEGRSGPAPEARVESLLRDLCSRSSSTRIRAAYQLGRLRHPRATEDLARATTDPRHLVRQAALAALLEIDPDRFAETAVALSRQISRAELYADLDAMVDAISRPSGGYADL